MMTPDSPEVESGAEVYDPALGEAYGHLAAALRLYMVEATDERLATLTSHRFLPAIEVVFCLGAIGMTDYFSSQLLSSRLCYVVSPLARRSTRCL